MPPFIRTQDLTHIYPAQPEPLNALEEVTLALARGESVAIIGANGSGKSTLARHLNALLQPTRGDVWVNEFNTREPANLRAIRRAVAMVFQNPESQFVATVLEEDVAFGPENFGVTQPELREHVERALAAVGLQSLRTRAPHELSAGQQQRLAIAGALALEPSALVLDEATAMLDPAAKESVLQLAAQLVPRQGILLTSITQAMEEAAQAERVIVMGRGRVRAMGTPREIFSNVDQLRELDLDLPPFAEIAHQLRARLGDFAKAQPILTLYELADAITLRMQSNETSPPPNTPSPAMVPGDSTTPPELEAPFRTKSTDQNGDPIIYIGDLRHTYLRGTPRAVEALRGVDVEIYRGEIVGIVGGSGSGKSTLLQHFNGLLRPAANEGQVTVAGVDLSNARANVRAVRQQIGLVFQFAERQLFERYVGDDIAFGPRQFGYSRDEVRERVRRAMRRVNLGFEEFKDRVTLTLSGGEKRRVALAGVLALEPRVLVLDEPTAGLDPRGRREFLASLRHWREQDGLTIVIVTHHMDEIAELCDRVYVLDRGKVGFTGSPHELFARGIDLAQFGLVPPPAVQLAQALRARGLQLREDAVTSAQVVEAIVQEL